MEKTISDKQELADYFAWNEINILVQGYLYGGPNGLHQDLEVSNYFGKSNKTRAEAAAFHKECRENGLNRFLLVHDRYEPDGNIIEDIRRIFTHKFYDYMKDYRGIQNDIMGYSIATSVNEESPNYVLKVLERNTEGIHKIVLHVTKEMDEDKTKDFYGFLSSIPGDYDNLRFLILDQMERGIEMLENYEVMRWGESG